MTELNDTLIDAQTEINAHRLGQFVNNVSNHEAIQERKRKLLDAAFALPTMAGLDILTQSAIARLIVSMANTHEDENLINDFRVAISIGYIIRSEEVTNETNR